MEILIMENTPLHYQTIAELAQGIRNGEVSIVELTEHLFQRIDQLDPALNAYRLVCRERALEEAKAMDGLLRAGNDLGPLHGIPYGAKDLFDVMGMPTTAGSKLLEKNIASADAPVIRKLSQAGMVFTGKTNTVQFAYSGVGINHDHGTPHNPWHRTPHAPGGSSSGSGVAVASGMVPMALGSDTGGSVRFPAALWGIPGVNTTVGRVSRAGVYPLSWSMDSIGPLTRSVEDAALAYQAMQGFEAQDDTTHRVEPHDVLKNLKTGIQGVRLAFAETVFFDDADPEIEKAVRECKEVFQNLGSQVDCMDVPEVEAAWQLNRKGMIIVSEAYTNNRRLLDEQYDQLDPIIATRMIKGKDVKASDYLDNMLEWKRLREKIVDTLKDVDALLVPTTCIPARPVETIDTDFEHYMEHNVAYLRNTSIGNILNFCGLTVPCGTTNQGLPIGLMIYGKPFQEDLVLRIGYAFQQITDWHKRTPDLDWIGGKE
jgi:aspartyl-tRNA(Asn)/glutamyl-tRNA(Gln) amidotransferase subunit A